MKNLTAHIRLFLTLGFVLTGFSVFAAHHGHHDKALKHVVVLKFKEDTSSAQIDEAVRLIRSFPNRIPEVKSVEGGENVTIEDAHKGFTHVFSMSFENQADLKVYLPHPYHLEVVEKLSPLFADVLVVDYFVN
ncbi:MAG: Dabb family protein [Synoicihabitans sp.]